VTQFLLDTHAFLWLQTTPERLGAARELVEDEQSTLFLSAASSWEIAIKWELGKLPLPEAPTTYVPARMRTSAVDGLAVAHAHSLRVSELPRLHRDPFDRLLVAQAQLERMTLVTGDEAIRAYDVELIWIG